MPLALGTIRIVGGRPRYGAGEIVPPDKGLPVGGAWVGHAKLQLEKRSWSRRFSRTATPVPGIRSFVRNWRPGLNITANPYIIEIPL